TGGLGSPAYPLLYGLVAFAMTVMARPGAVATLAAALLLEAALVMRGPIREPALLAAGIHAAYLAGAAAAHAVLLRGLTARCRRPGSSARWCAIASRCCARRPSRGSCRTTSPAAPGSRWSRCR